MTNGLSDTIYRIINIAPCLRHWIGIESVIDIPSFLVVISQRKWSKISTDSKKSGLYFRNFQIHIREGLIESDGISAVAHVWSSVENVFGKTDDNSFSLQLQGLKVEKKEFANQQNVQFRFDSFTKWNS